jgi:hypothetical protein
MNSLMKRSLLLILSLLLQACSSAAWYESAKASAANECRKLPPGAYEDCMSRTPTQTYDDYEKERRRQ